MKIIMLSPNAKNWFTEKDFSVLEESGDFQLISKVKPIKGIKELHLPGEKVVAIDPDYCDWSVTKADLDNILELKSVCLQSTSFSWIDIDYLTKRNIPLLNIQGYSSVAVAEYATLMVLMLARKLSIIVKDKWKQDNVKHRGIELSNKTVGIIGLGKIGESLAKNMHGLGMRVQYWSKNSRNKDYKYTSLENLMKTSDVVIPSVVRNAETKNLITDKMIKSMKTSAIFVSIVHDVYNHKLLLKQASEGKIYGYGFEEHNGNPSKYKGNVLSVSEIAWCTDESLRKNVDQWINCIIRSTKGDYPNKVN